MTTTLDSDTIERIANRLTKARPKLSVRPARRVATGMLAVRQHLMEADK